MVALGKDFFEKNSLPSVVNSGTRERFFEKKIIFFAECQLDEALGKFF
jgi:hypothetical protein